jgi:hypothetical protein
MLDIIEAGYLLCGAGTILKHGGLEHTKRSGSTVLFL